MPKNILCTGGKKRQRLELFLTILPYLKKKRRIDFISIGKEKPQKEIEKIKESGIQTFYYGGTDDNISNEIGMHQVYNEDEHSLCHWFDSECEYESICPDLRIYLINKDSSLVKWYKANMKYNISSEEDKISVFLQYWQKHNKQNLWFSKNEGFFEGILQYDVGWHHIFCYLDNNDENIQNAIELYCFLHKFVPRGSGGAIKSAENFIRRSSRNILALNKNSVGFKDNLNRLKKIII